MQTASLEYYMLLQSPVENSHRQQTTWKYMLWLVGTTALGLVKSWNNLNTAEHYELFLIRLFFVAYGSNLEWYESPHLSCSFLMLLSWFCCSQMLWEILDFLGLVWQRKQVVCFTETLHTLVAYFHQMNPQKQANISAGYLRFLVLLLECCVLSNEMRFWTRCGMPTVS